MSRGRESNNDNLTFQTDDPFGLYEDDYSGMCFATENCMRVDETKKLAKN